MLKNGHSTNILVHPLGICGIVLRNHSSRCQEVHRIADLSYENLTAFVGEDQAERIEEKSVLGPLDRPDDETDSVAAQPATPLRGRDNYDETETLEEIDLPGNPKHEAARKRCLVAITPQRQGCNTKVTC